MAERHVARFIGLCVCVFICTMHLKAQPLLPDLSAAVQGSVVSLSWNCQYGGVKAISVLRSADSSGNYEIIGYVKNTDKGVQTFEDVHPAEGKIYYKLSIVFSSGVTWHSNHVSVTVQHLLPASRESDFKGKPESQNLLSLKLQKADTCIASKGPHQKLTLSLTEDTSHPAHAATVRPRIVLRQREDTTDLAPPVCIRSGLVFTDSVTGHVNMFLPNDVTAHHYSVKFYDLKNHLLFDVPKINTAKIIFDRRNFQHKGVYKFVIRKDYTELESGYIIVGN